jgi:hypothetical protein
VPPDTFVCKQIFLASEPFRQLLLRVEIVNSVVAQLTGHHTPISHLLLPVPLDVPLSSVNGFGDQMVFGEQLFSAAKFASTIIVAFHAAIILAF